MQPGPALAQKPSQFDAHAVVHQPVDETRWTKQDHMLSMHLTRPKAI